MYYQNGPYYANYNVEQNSTPPPQSDGDMFQQAPRARDPFWGILFIIQVLGIIALSGYGTYKYATGSPQDIYVDISSQAFRQIMIITAICIGSAVLISFLWLQAVKRFARQLIIGTFVAAIALWAIFGVWVLAQGSLGGLFMLLMAGILAMFFYWWRSRIPFATTMLESISQRTRDFPATIYSGYIMLIVHVIWNAFFFWTLSVSQFYNQSVSTLLLIFYLLSYYWTTQVIKNVLHVTVSGAFATWYFMANNMPRNPTLNSFKRATTTSFGSISLGSLLVAILETLRTLVQAARRQGDNIFAFCADCILGFIDSLLQYFNLYAFTQVAIYGKSYIQAAKDTWALVHSHGIEAIINDSLIGNVLTIGSLVGGVICGIVGAVLGALFVSEYWAITTTIGFLTGFAMLSVVMAVVESGVATIFVCFAMDKEALRRSDALLYQKFMETYYV